MKKKAIEFEKFPTRRIPGEPVSRMMVLQSSGIVKTPVTDMQKIKLKLVHMQRRQLGGQQDWRT